MWEGVDLQIYANVLRAVMRYLAPALALLLLWRCGLPLLTFRREPEIWAWLTMKNGDRLPITHWENVLGSGKRCDVVMAFPNVARNHAVLIRYDDGSWCISATDDRAFITVNGEKKRISEVKSGDQIGIAGVEMDFQPITEGCRWGKQWDSRVDKLTTYITVPNREGVQYWNNPSDYVEESTWVNDTTLKTQLSDIPSHTEYEQRLIMPKSYFKPGDNFVTTGLDAKDQIINDQNKYASDREFQKTLGSIVNSILGLLLFGKSLFQSFKDS